MIPVVAVKAVLRASIVFASVALKSDFTLQQIHLLLSVDLTDEQWALKKTMSQELWWHLQEVHRRRLLLASDSE
jgi:hypothetical protein